MSRQGIPSPARFLEAPAIGDMYRWKRPSRMWASSASSTSLLGKFSRQKGGDLLHGVGNELIGFSFADMGGRDAASLKAMGSLMYHAYVATVVMGNFAPPE